MTGEGSVEKPFRENPPEHLKEVHWSGARFAVLTVTMTEMNDLSSDALDLDMTLPDGTSGIVISRAEWIGFGFVLVKYFNIFYVELLATGEISPGSAIYEFDSVRINYLIDFSVLKANGFSEVLIEQFWSNNLSTLSDDVRYENKFELHTYITDTFMIPEMVPGTGATSGTAGPNDFRIVPANGEKPIYDETRTVIWNYREQGPYHPVLTFSKTGWV